MYTDKPDQHIDAVDLVFLVAVGRAFYIFRLHFCVFISFVPVHRDIFIFFSSEFSRNSNTEMNERMENTEMVQMR